MTFHWSTYEYQPSFVLGFHGCDQDVGEAILSGQERHLKWSEKKYDWLGHGIYFWEGNPARALEWAENRKERQGDEPYDSIRAPFLEGDGVYPSSGFRSQNHIQLCVRETEKCIKGYFRPIASNHRSI